MKFSILLPLASLLALVVSDDIDNPQHMTPCLLDCNKKAAKAVGCSTYLDSECTCASDEYTAVLKRCLAANCDAYDDQFSKILHIQICKTPL
ncbi:hypothetical protein N7492_002209 [Penicillium capsulatum]|uniref:CFEM domain-containing protein n=1 Tax=Penicillium capsulatum TaxID=69766 RepID=A0A9W9IJL5_9EURO|nr:hypothetical protein N7492_002209 [Penicillium capsulatum]KAJ6123184.1 hypothetical protein N7512_005649 [Penicillium capsulatum]